jgi:hypothetical protein
MPSLIRRSRGAAWRCVERDKALTSAWKPTSRSVSPPRGPFFRVGDHRKRVALRRLFSPRFPNASLVCSQTRKWIRSVSSSQAKGSAPTRSIFFVRRSYCRLSENAHQTSANPANRSAATNITTAAIIVSIIICSFQGRSTGAISWGFGF